MLEEILLITFLWLIAWSFLTFMDRVDEHDLIIWRFKTPIAYIFAILTAISFIWVINYFSFLYPFLFWLCIEWIIKNKLEYPSHVFFLFLIAIYFWYRFDLFFEYYLYIIIFLLITFFIWNFLKNKLNKNSNFYNALYKSYFSKTFINIVFALILFKPILIFFSLGFTYSCLFIKKYFPWRNP